MIEYLLQVDSTLSTQLHVLGNQSMYASLRTEKVVVNLPINCDACYVTEPQLGSLGAVSPDLWW